MKCWKRVVLAVAATLAVSAAAFGYAGFRLMMRKNPDVVREIKAADDKQKALDDVFDSPVVAEEHPR
jgi:hypothetical protein